MLEKYARMLETCWLMLVSEFSVNFVGKLRKRVFYRFRLELIWTTALTTALGETKQNQVVSGVFVEFSLNGYFFNNIENP